MEVQQARSAAGGEPREYDLFLSHATPDKDWVLSLASQLEGLGLRVFVDTLEIDPGDNWVIRLSNALENSRYLVLVLSGHTDGRPWVLQEWTSYMAGHGPLGRLLPVKIDAVDLPFILNATQAIDALDRNAVAAASRLFGVVGDSSTLGADDPRRTVLGRDLPFTLARDGDQLRVTTPSGETRALPLPWNTGNEFGIAYLGFTRLQRGAITSQVDRAELFRHARTLGEQLFALLFDETGAQRLQGHIAPAKPRPVIQLRSTDPLLLSLPWELLHRAEQFLIGEGLVDLVRTTPDDVDGQTLLKAPTGPFKLTVNVSAPEGSNLSYEAESYRIALATAERCEMVPTELGTLADLVETVWREQPTGIHFSGHGKPGALLFENEEGREDEISVDKLIATLRHKLPDARRLPPFFYLASCYGNEPTAPEENVAGSPSAAVQLHRAGVTEVVGYFGPIADPLSTRAEEALYEAIAEGLPTRDAVRLARQELKCPFHDTHGAHRPGPARSVVAPLEEATVAADTHPFAWAQLVYYHRGPEWPLSTRPEAGKRSAARVLKRDFEGFLDRKVLRAGFIGRRTEQHRLRRRIREGQRVFVLQGLGGLGKSTLAQQVLPWLVDDPKAVCTLWCQEVEQQESKAEALVGQLLAYCRGRFGLDWEGVVQQVDHLAGNDPARRFLSYLHVLAKNAPGLALYFDNLESLLVGPQDEDSGATIGEWADPALETIWRATSQMARDSGAFTLVASCRYRHPDFGEALLPVSPLPPDALFRLTEWFPALQKLSAHGRARLAARLEGHPRAVEYANDLVQQQLTAWHDQHGAWQLSVPPTEEAVGKEWRALIEPALPQVAEKLKDNLLLQAIWARVLDARARRFLYRMTVLRQPAKWSLLALLGDEDEPEQRALATAERLRATSLLEQQEVLAQVAKEKVALLTHYTLHPATVRFITQAHGEDATLERNAHRRLGEHLEAEAKTSPYFDTDIEAGYHLFEAGEFDRAFELLGSASEWLQERGRVREGLRLLAPFLGEAVQHRLESGRRGQLLGTVGNAYLRLGEVQKAIGYYEQQLVIDREIGDRRGEGTALGNLGTAYARLGEVRKAIGYYEQGLVIAREIGNRRGEGADLGNLGIAYAALGEVRKAIGYYEQLLVIAREIGDRQGEGNALGNLGSAYLRLGDVQKAIGYYEQDLVIVRNIGDRRGEGNAFGSLGNAYLRLGEVQKAIGHYEQGLVIVRELGDRRGEGYALGSLGSAYLLLGEVRTAIRYCEQCLVVVRELGDRRGEGNALGNLGSAYLRLGDVQKAIGYYEQQLVIVREIGDRQGEGHALGNLGSAYLRLGELQKATALLEQAKAIGEQIGDPQIVQVTTSLLAKLRQG